MMENIYTATRMEAIVEDISADDSVAMMQEEEQPPFGNGNLIDNSHLNGIACETEEAAKYFQQNGEMNPLGKSGIMSDTQSATALHLNTNSKDVDGLVCQILSPDTAEFINFENQMKEMSQKRPSSNISHSDVDGIPTSEETNHEWNGTENSEIFAQKSTTNYTDDEIHNLRKTSIERTLSSSSNSTAYSVSDLTQVLNSSEFRRTSEHKRSLSSMELQEQQQMERLALQTELETKLEERKRSLNGSMRSDSDSVVSNEHNKCSDDKSDPLLLMQQRKFRTFNRADEYLYAMKEDLAEWLNMLYTEIEIDAENFMDRLETGEILVKVRHNDCNTACTNIHLIITINARIVSKF